MTQLAETVTAEDELWTLDSLPSTQYVVVEDETIEVRAPFPSQTYTLTGETLPPRIRVRRGIAGTTKASHLSGATLTPNYGLGSSGGGGGAIAVDDTVNPPAEVTTLLSPAAVVSGSTGYIRPVIVSETDPSPGDFSWNGDSNYDGVLWLQTDELARFVALRVWESVDGVWLDAGIGDMLAGNVFEMTGYSANGTEGNATFEFGGSPGGVIKFHLKEEDGANDRNYELKLGGDVVSLFFTDPDAFSPDNGIQMNGDGILFTGQIGFNNGVAIPRPVVPLTTPDAQDVIDALVALGLITQSD